MVTGSDQAVACGVFRLVGIERGEHDRSIEERAHRRVRRA